MSQNENLEELLKKHQRRLQKLKEQQALQGIETPPSILLEIEDIEAKIEELQAELEASKRGEGKAPPTGPDIVNRLAGIEAKIDALQQDLEALKRGEVNESPSGSLPQISVATDISLTPQERTLLQHIFEGYSQVLVQKEFDGGYSGTRVLLTLPSAADGTPAAAKVTKLGWTLELRRERDNYQQVKNFLPFCIAPIVGYYEQVDLATLNYEWVGGGALGRVVDLEESHRTHPVEQIVKTLTDLLDRELGQRWYSQSTPLRSLFAAEYGPHMVEHLRLKLHPASSDGIWPVGQSLPEIPAYRPLDLETLHQEREVIPPDTLVSIEGLVVARLKAGLVKLQDPGEEGIVIRVESEGVPSWLQVDDRVGVRGRVVYNRRSRMEQIVRQVFPNLEVQGESIKLPGVPEKTYPNPLIEYSQVLGKVLEGRRSYVHGDLHLRNVLVDEGGRGWLIDFARVEKRHNLFDFIKLETYIRLMELAANDLAFSLDEYVKFEEALNNATLDQNATPPANPHLKKAYEVILAIRRIARKYMGPEPDFRKEYFPALFLYCLAVMKYYMEQNPRPTWLVFATACVLGKEERIIPEGCLSKIRKLLRKYWGILVFPGIFVLLSLIVLLTFIVPREINLVDQPLPTPMPIATATPPTIPSSEICPGRREIGEVAESVEVKVDAGQVVYIIGWGFDPSGDGHLEYGGYFVTINGPYMRTHVVQNGMYCLPVPANSDQARATQKMLEEACEAGADGCNHLTLPSTEICPGRRETGPGTELIEVKVGPGEVAYIIGVGFDPAGDGNIKYGGYFVTINGPYERTHTVQNGVYCPPVPANTEQAQATQRMLEGECQGKCNHQITLP